MPVTITGQTWSYLRPDAGRPPGSSSGLGRRRSCRVRPRFSPAGHVRGRGPFRRQGGPRMLVLGWWYVEQAVDGLAVHGLLLDEQVGELSQFALMAAQQRRGVLFGLAQQARYLAVDFSLGGLGEGTAGHPGAAAAKEHRAALRVTDRAQGRGQAELTDHLDRQVGGGRQVVSGPGGALAKLDQFGGTPAEAHGQGLGEVVLAVEVPLDQGQLLG